MSTRTIKRFLGLRRKPAPRSTAHIHSLYSILPETSAAPRAAATISEHSTTVNISAAGLPCHPLIQIGSPVLLSMHPHVQARPRTVSAPLILHTAVVEPRRQGTLRPHLQLMTAPIPASAEPASPEVELASPLVEPATPVAAPTAPRSWVPDAQFVCSPFASRTCSARSPVATAASWAPFLPAADARAWVPDADFVGSPLARSRLCTPCRPARDAYFAGSLLGLLRVPSAASVSSAAYPATLVPEEPRPESSKAATVPPRALLLLPKGRPAGAGVNDLLSRLGREFSLDVRQYSEDEHESGVTRVAIGTM